MKNYEELERQGRLLILPCRLGSKVYVVTSYERGREFVHTGYDHLGETGYYKTEYGYTYKETEFRMEHLKEFGKRVFLTRREAIEEVSRRREMEK